MCRRAGDIPNAVCTILVIKLDRQIIRKTTTARRNDMAFLGIELIHPMRELVLVVQTCNSDVVFSAKTGGCTGVN